MATDSTRRLHHNTPAWVQPDAVFHVRIRTEKQQASLVDKTTVLPLLESAQFYHEPGIWFCHLLLLMPDHLHALLCFPPDSDMRAVVGRWKAWQTRTPRIAWQDNFFDHRIRDQKELQLKAAYIRQNPVVKSLCKTPDDWPWIFDPLSRARSQ